MGSVECFCPETESHQNMLSRLVMLSALCFQRTILVAVLITDSREGEGDQLVGCVHSGVGSMVAWARLWQWRC